jgi:anti-anti-sigma factor
LRNAVLSEECARTVVLDLADVQALDAGGLGLLVSLHHWAEANHVQLKLANPRPFVRAVLARTHLDRVFDISSFNDAQAWERQSSKRKTWAAQVRCA